MIAPRQAERGTYLGHITFPAMSRTGGTAEAFSQVTQSSAPFPLPTAGGNIYVVLEVRTTDTPESAQEFALTFVIDTNS